MDLITKVIIGILGASVASAGGVVIWKKTTQTKGGDAQTSSQSTGTAGQGSTVSGGTTQLAGQSATLTRFLL